MLLSATMLSPVGTVITLDSCQVTATVYIAEYIVYTETSLTGAIVTVVESRVFMPLKKNLL
jgi:hypothetical protein